MHVLSLIAAAWIGVVVTNAIGAGAKFDADLLTREAGLDVGRHVFRAVGRLEWLLAAAILAMVSTDGEVTTAMWVPILALVALVAVQTFWLRPILDARAAAIIAEHDVPKSRAHAAYMVTELLKLIAAVVVVVIDLSGAAAAALPPGVYP